VLVNPKNPLTESLMKDVRTMATAIGRQVEVVSAGNEGDIDTAFAILVQRGTDALVVHPDVLFIAHRVHLAALAARHALPVIWPFRTDAEAGGLMSYGVKLADAHRQAGVYCGRILRGANPAELPVVQPTRFELIINLKTARALGLDVPPTLLARADEVIE
jgi:putative ABC transport system substrate-binding protein